MYLLGNNIVIMPQWTWRAEWVIDSFEQYMTLKTRAAFFQIALQETTHILNTLRASYANLKYFICCKLKQYWINLKLKDIFDDLQLCDAALN